ncbi:MAG: 2TM domain-containing protein [Ilumatobacter sp.]
MSAELWVEQRRAFNAHAAVFGATMVLVVAVNLVTNLAAGTAGDWSAWWSVWALIGSSLGLAVHGFVVWLNRPVLESGAT